MLVFLSCVTQVSTNSGDYSHTGLLLASSSLGHKSCMFKLSPLLEYHEAEIKVLAGLSSPLEALEKNLVVSSFFLLAEFSPFQLYY